MRVFCFLTWCMWCLSDKNSLATLFDEVNAAVLKRDFDAAKRISQEATRHTDGQPKLQGLADLVAGLVLLQTGVNGKASDLPLATDHLTRVVQNEELRGRTIANAMADINRIAKGCQEGRAVLAQMRHLLSHRFGTVSNSFRVEEKDIFVVDGALSEEEHSKLVEQAEKQPYSKHEKATVAEGEVQHSFWSSEHSTHMMCEVSPVGKQVKHWVQHLFPDCRQPTCIRAYTNAAQHGDNLVIHVDSYTFPAFFDVTALYYPHREWDINWNGETVFYTGNYTTPEGKVNRKSGEIAAAVLPWPGRMVFFDGRLRHSGRVPQKEFLGRRFSIAFKVKCLRDEQGASDKKSFSMAARLFSEEVRGEIDPEFEYDAQGNVVEHDEL